jgi:hypothetical protein
MMMTTIELIFYLLILAAVAFACTPEEDLIDIERD